MASNMIALVVLLVTLLPNVHSEESDLYGMVTYLDSACQTPVADESNGLSEYKMHHFSADAHCYFHKGYSIKLSCGPDDTVAVDHWLDLTGKLGPCMGAKIVGEPLMKDIPWELALDFFNGDCVRSASSGKYAKLTAALPSDGFPKCDYTGASIRRLSGNATNGTNSTAPTAAPTPAPTSTPVPTPAPASANGTSNATNNTNTSAPTPAPAPTPVGTASGAITAKFALASIATTLVVCVFGLGVEF